MQNLFLEGFLLQASLILALGAQNLFVLDSGLRRRHHLFAALVCSVCDQFLVGIGVLGFASLAVQLPLVKILFGLLGLIFLLVYGVAKVREGFQLPDGGQAVGAAAVSLKQTFWVSLGFSLLNPHALLDTIVLIGGYSTKFSSFSERVYFGVGAGSFSALWFFALASFAAYLSPVLQKPRLMKMISLGSGLLLLWLALKLGLEMRSWS